MTKFLLQSTRQTRHTQDIQRREDGQNETRHDLKSQYHVLDKYIMILLLCKLYWLSMLQHGVNYNFKLLIFSTTTWQSLLLWWEILILCLDWPVLILSCWISLAVPERVVFRWCVSSSSIWFQICSMRWCCWSRCATDVANCKLNMGFIRNTGTCSFLKGMERWNATVNQWKKRNKLQEIAWIKRREVKCLE